MTTVDEAVRRLRQAPDRPGSIAGSIKVLAIDGPSGAGKTTFADRLQVAVSGAGRPVPVIHLDDLYPGWNGLADVVPRLLEWVLQPVAAGGDPRYRRYDWPSGRYAEWHSVDLTDAEVLIVEGVGSGSLPCAPYLSVLVWVDAPPALRMARGISRDGEAYRPHWKRWAAQEAALFEREGTAHRADLVVNGAG